MLRGLNTEPISFGNLNMTTGLDFIFTPMMDLCVANGILDTMLLQNSLIKEVPPLEDRHSNESSKDMTF